VFVDVHDVRGRFIDTVSPPFAGREAPRAWTLPAGASGILQLEAYHFTHAPGESTAVTRIHATNDPPRKALASLLAAHHAGLDVARVDRTYDREIEKAYLDRLAKLDLPAGQAAQVHAFLLQTIPLRVHGPPLRLATRERDLAAMAKTQRRWTIGLRFFLLGGGGLFLLAMTLTMARTHAAAAAATMAELERIGSMDESLDAAREVARARRAALWRGLAVVAVMAAGLVLTTVMLESLLWVF
jgi:hypothetical protein